MNPRKAGLALEGLGKRFGDTESVSDVTLRVGPGELMALLGSSGAGKSTILRCIAGHLEPDAGEVWIGGERMDQAPPEKRNVGMVFQSYALFPHLNVRRNVAFGPERRGASRSEAAELADEMLDRVGLLELGDRYPRQISGGEQQRVAVARALAIRPEVLLLDEPLSSLDQTLRRELRSLLRRLQQSFGATTVWVTHDQEEALTVADRVAVLDRGRLQQVGTPLELHTRPANTFVASFVGKMNLLPATPEAGGGDAFRLRDGPVVRVARDALPGPASPGPASPGPASEGFRRCGRPARGGNAAGGGPDRSPSGGARLQPDRRHCPADLLPRRPSGDRTRTCGWAPVAGARKHPVRESLPRRRPGPHLLAGCRHSASLRA